MTYNKAFTLYAPHLSSTISFVESNMRSLVYIHEAMKAIHDQLSFLQLDCKLVSKVKKVTQRSTSKMSEMLI